MYDEEGNLITNPDSSILDTDEEDIDTPDGHEEEDQDDDDAEYVKISKQEHNRLTQRDKKAKRLEKDRAKHIIKHQEEWPQLYEKLKALEEKLTAKERQEQESEIKSIYASADVEQVRSLTSKWLSVKQAINALYAEEMVTKSNPYAGWFIGSTTSNPVSAGKQLASERIKKSLWIIKQ